MCLDLSENHIEETKSFKNSSTILKGYKLLKVEGDNFFSPYQDFEFKIGKSYKSSRESTTLTVEEFGVLKTNEGFHFYENVENYFCNSEDMLCLYRHRRPCPCRYLCRYLSRRRYSWFEFEANSEDIVSVGKFDDFNSFVSTKCKLIKKIQ